MREHRLRPRYIIPPCKTSGTREVTRAGSPTPGPRTAACPWSVRNWATQQEMREQKPSPPSPVLGKTVFHDTSPWCQKSLGTAPYRLQNMLFSKVWESGWHQSSQCFIFCLLLSISLFALLCRMFPQFYVLILLLLFSFLYSCF